MESVIFKKCCTLLLAGVNTIYLDKNKSFLKNHCYLGFFFTLWLCVAFTVNLYHIFREITRTSAGITVVFSFVVSVISNNITCLALRLKSNQLLQLRGLIKQIGVNGTSKVYYLLNMLRALNVIMFFFFQAILLYL